MTKQGSPRDFPSLIKAALDLARQPELLGHESPLAAPYFLGNYLLQQPSELQQSALGRGSALIVLLRNALADLPGHHPAGAEYQQLLELSYFQRLDRRKGDLWDQLGMSRATYFRKRNEAVEACATTLIRRVNPALRLEEPRSQIQLIGRKAEVQNARQGLLHRQSVGIAGPSGIGKTTLATQILSQCASQASFWYTIYPGVNDQLQSLLFALAYFLHGRGASTLWMQLLAERQQGEIESLFALLRNDLATIADQAPIFCFDEVDLLQPESSTHMQVLQFLEGFPKGFGLLLIGQTIPIVTEQFIALTGLQTPQLQGLLAASDVRLTNSQLIQFAKQTHGNPRLVKLYLTLHESGEPLNELLAKLTHAPSLEALLQRIWQRLPEAERTILLELAVYRRAAPVDVWQAVGERAALQQLLHRQLVQSDGKGGITLLAAYRRTLLNQLTPELREVLHTKAAMARAFGQEMTAAAYHWAQAREYATAVRLWYAHREQEIDQGQASAALHIFDDISSTQLADEEEQQLLGLIRGELHKLLGNYQRAQATLQAVNWRTPRLAALARRLAGDVAELTGELERARIAYTEGLHLTDGLLEQELALFHRDLSWIARRQRTLDEAWTEALRAEYEVENLKGHILRDRGDFVGAEQQFSKALALAETLHNLDSEAKTRNALAAVLIKQGRFREAEIHFERSYQLFRQIGKLLSVASVRVNQAVACMLDGRPGDAIPHAQRARGIFERLQHPYGVATVYQSLAEAHLAIGDLDQALRYGEQAIECEEGTIIPDALRVIGEVHLARQQLQVAEGYMTQAIAEAQNNGDRYLEAYAYRARAKVYKAMDDARLQRDIAEAIMIFEEIPLPEEVARCRQL